MRKLASIQKILSVTQIIDPKTGEPANSIEAVKVLGWECVAKKGLHKVGDLVVYFEIDSIVPEHHLKALGLWNHEQMKGMLGKKGDVLTTKKMLGVLSQGLVAPTDILGMLGGQLIEGDDVTEYLGITKYERFVEDETENSQGPKKSRLKRELIKFIRPVLYWISHNIPGANTLIGQVAQKNSWFRQFVGGGGSFPDFIHKTDQTRVQNLTRNWEDLIDDEFEITEKMEGTSSTYFYRKGDYGMCSRNLRKTNFDTSHFGIVQKKYGIFEKLRKYKKNIAIQGEICGPGIQGNYYGLSDFNLYIFDVFLIDEARKALPRERASILTDLGLDKNTAPIVGWISRKGWTIQEILKNAEGKSLINPKVEAEGRVYKSITKPEVHFKAINNNYLLKQK